MPQNFVLDHLRHEELSNIYNLYTYLIIEHSDVMAVVYIEEKGPPHYGARFFHQDLVFILPLHTLSMTQGQPGLGFSVPVTIHF